MSKLFYTDLSQFSTPPSEEERTLSRYYNEMSKGQLKIVAEVYPRYIQVNVAKPSMSFLPANNAVAQRLASNGDLGGTFDWTRFDNRKNNPLFNPSSYNTTFASPDRDGAPDYVVIMWRTTTSFATGHTEVWESTAGHVFPSSGTTLFTTNYTSGMTICSGLDNVVVPYKGYGFRNVFTHELGHMLYNGSHTYGANGCIFPYFSTGRGWSMMNHDEGPSSANAWERYKLGWIDDNDVIFKTYGQSDNSTVTIGDFVTTGKAVCITIPGHESNQRIWLEYRGQKSIWDKRDSYSNDGLGRQICERQSGVYAYIENSRGGIDFSIPNFAFDGNTFKTVPVIGAYDVVADPVVANANPASWTAWGNQYMSFQKSDPNPFSWSSQQWFRRWRKRTGFSSISTNFEANGTGWGTQEGWNFIREGVDRCRVSSPDNLDFWGDGYQNAFKSDAFLMGWNRLNIAHSLARLRTWPTPPSPVNFGINGNFGQRILINGLELKVVSIDDVNKTAQVYLGTKANELTTLARITGNLEIPNVPNLEHELVVSGCDGKLLVNASKVPNVLVDNQINSKPSHLLPFVTPTILRVSGSVRIEENAEMSVEESSALVLSGSLVVNGNLNLTSDATLWIKAGSTFSVGPKGNVYIAAGCHVHVEPGATINIDQTAILNFAQSELWDLTANTFVGWESTDNVPVNSVSQLRELFGTLVLDASSCTPNGLTDSYCGVSIVARYAGRQLYNTPGAWVISNIVPSGISSVPATLPSNSTEASFSFTGDVTQFTLSFTPTGGPYYARTFNVNYQKPSFDIITGNPTCDCYWPIDPCVEEEPIPFDPGARVRNQGAVSGLSTYPNPVTRQLTIDGLSAKSEHHVKVVNNLGTAYSFTLPVGQNTIDLTLLPPGIYYCVASDDNTTFPPFKIVKQ